MWFRAGFAVIGTVYAVSYWMSQTVYQIAVANSRTLGDITNQMSFLEKNIKNLDSRLIKHHEDIKIEFKDTNTNINDVWEATDIISNQVHELHTESLEQYRNLIGQMLITHNKIDNIHSNLSSISQIFNQNINQIAVYDTTQQNTNEIVSSIEKKLDYIINFIHTPVIE